MFVTMTTFIRDHFSAFGNISVLQASNRIFSDAYTCGSDVMQIIGTGPVVQLSLELPGR